MDCCVGEKRKRPPAAQGNSAAQLGMILGGISNESALSTSGSASCDKARGLQCCVPANKPVAAAPPTPALSSVQIRDNLHDDDIARMVQQKMQRHRMKQKAAHPRKA